MDTGKVVGWLLFAGILALVSGTGSDAVKSDQAASPAGSQPQDGGTGADAQAADEAQDKPVRVGEGPNSL